MPRDYKNVNRKTKRSDKARGGDLLSFITGLGIGLVVALAVYLYQFLPAPLVMNHQPPAQKTAAAPAAGKHPTVPEPKFDFYKILPNKEVNISEWEEQNKANSPPDIEKGGIYVLQVGSFKTYDAADQTKARLALLGISADIQRVVINGEDIRHRVRIGPYRDPKKLEGIRKRLIANHINFVVLRLKVDELASGKN